MFPISAPPLISQALLSAMCLCVVGVGTGGGRLYLRRVGEGYMGLIGAARGREVRAAPKIFWKDASRPRCSTDGILAEVVFLRLGVESRHSVTNVVVLDWRRASWRPRTPATRLSPGGGRRIDPFCLGVTF